MENSKYYYSNAEVAQNYDKERFTSKAGQIFDAFEKNVVISHLPDNSDILVLDAGAGTGRFTIEMARKNLKVVSCDYSESMLDVIRLKLEENHLEDYVTLLKQDITQLIFDSDKFDYISCMRVLVNLDTKENVINALNEFKRVCKPGGTIILDIVNPMSLSALGPKKESYLTLNEFKEIINSVPDLEIKKYYGRRILSQTAFEKAPDLLLGLMDIIDKKLSKLFPMYCVRIYFELKKR